MTNRFFDRVRHSNPDLDLLPTERLGRLRRGISLEMSSLWNDETIDRFHDSHLTEAIAELKKMNRSTRLENVLYSWYLRRVEFSKMIETFDEFEAEGVTNTPEKHFAPTRTTMHARLPESARRLAVKKHSLDSSAAVPLWSKLVSNWREHMYEAFLQRVEQEKLSIAAYEIEQIQLDWERMKMNAQLSLEHYDVLLRAAESDVNAQQALNDDLQKNVNKVRHGILGGKTHNSHSAVPAELLLSRIQQSIRSRISRIGLLRIDTARTQKRIRERDLEAYTLEHSHEKMHEIDVNFVRTRKVDYVDIYEKLDRQYKIEKSSQYPVLRQLQDLRKKLAEHEQVTIDCESKSRLLENRLEKINQEIAFVKRENEDLANENITLRHGLADIKEVPSITNYAYIIGQTKALQHDIDVWTRRVTIAETLLSQLKEQTKSSTVLPPIGRTVPCQRQSRILSAEWAMPSRGCCNETPDPE